MEPMTLGSPVHNPLSLPQSSPSTGTDTAMSDAFYPSYLMGESPVPVGLRIAPGGMSPTRSLRPFSVGASTPSPASPQPFKETTLPGSRSTSERQGGPPVMGLASNSPFNYSPSIRNNTNPLREISFGVSSPCTPGQQSSIQNLVTPHRGSSCEYEKENLSEIGRWITVFGFSLLSASTILSHFAQLGVITDHRLPIKGNWMHIKFQNPLQARKALAKNGKIIDGSIMIGVSPCNEQSLHSDLNESISSPISREDMHIRPLTSSFHSPRQDKVAPPKVRTPQKSDGFVAKALQHILGI